VCAVTVQRVSFRHTTDVCEDQNVLRNWKLPNRQDCCDNAKLPGKRRECERPLNEGCLAFKNSVADTSLVCIARHIEDLHPLLMPGSQDSASG
jgi:hypothetical protein